MAGVTTAGDAGKNDWQTPPDFVVGIEQWLGDFTLDVAASDHNALALAHYTEADDGLVQPWSGTVWCNPPWGRGMIEPWVRKAVAESLSERHPTIAMLVPVKSEQDWFHIAAMWASEMLFVQGRQRFVGATSGCPYATVLFVFRGMVAASDQMATVGFIDRAGMRI